MMQAAVTSSSCRLQVGAGVVSTVVKTQAISHKPLATFRSVTAHRSQNCCFRLRVQAQPTEQSEYVDYEGKTSVFPAEECDDTGENCDAQGVWKEVNPSPSAAKTPPESPAGPDREYQEYTEEKTVFPGEACEELGGEFCEPTFQQGVFPDKVTAAPEK